MIRLLRKWLIKQTAEEMEYLIDKSAGIINLNAKLIIEGRLMDKIISELQEELEKKTEEIKVLKKRHLSAVEK